MSEKKNIWFGFIGSFSPRFYRSIASQSFARSFGYLVLLLLLTSAVLSAKITFNARIAIQKSLEWINTELASRIPEFLPEINIKNGEVSSPAKQPLIYEWKDSAFVLDTTGTITSLSKYKSGILIMEHALMIKHTENNKTQTEEYDLSKIKSFKIAPGEKKGEFIILSFEQRSFSLTQKDIEMLSDIVGKVIFPVVTIAFFLYFLFAKFLHLFLFSLLSLIVNTVTDTKLKYDNLLNIGIFALTPPVIFSALVLVLGLNIAAPFVFLLYIGLYSLFLVMAISECKNINSYYLP